jgi:hypothetical protein
LREETDLVALNAKLGRVVYFWARRTERRDYEIRTVPSSLGEPSASGGVFPMEGLEEHYEEVD